MNQPNNSNLIDLYNIIKSFRSSIMNENLFITWKEDS